MKDRTYTLLDRILAAGALGALVACLLRLAWPAPPWWFVGLLVAVVALFPPTTPRK